MVEYMHIIAGRDMRAEHERHTPGIVAALFSPRLLARHVLPMRMVPRYVMSIVIGVTGLFTLYHAAPRT